MSFFTKLMADAQPKAESMANTTKSVATRVANSAIVQASGKLAYKGLVNTVGIAMVVGKPVVDKVVDKVVSYTKEEKHA